MHEDGLADAILLHLMTRTEIDTPLPDDDGVPGYLRSKQNEKRRPCNITMQKLARE